MTRSFGWLASLASLFAAVAISSCASTPARPAKLRPIPAALAAQGGFIASAALADITPPLHLSLFGHGPESRIATGVRLRLRCEVFVVGDGKDLVALVPCDLQSPSMALQRAVVKRLRDYGVPIGADRLFLMATHTHAGPAHYFEARRYSGVFSSQLPGYDQLVVDFLSGRIADAIVTAFSSLTPACVGWHQEKRTGLTFNRSYVPFLANHQTNTADDPLNEAKQAEQASYAQIAPGASAELAKQATPTGDEAAVDSRLSVLALTRRGVDGATCDKTKPIGVLAVYGMHPTGVPNTNELYHGDIFGFAVRAAEGRITRANAGDPNRDAAWAAESAPPLDPDHPHVIVGLANGVEGDNSPKINSQSMVNARKLGSELGQSIALAVDKIPALESHGTLKHLYWDLKFPRGQYDDDPAHVLCDTGELGAASGGGARDGPTRLRIIPETNAGYRPDHPSGCHTYKLPLRAGSASEHDYPQIAPIGLIQIGAGLFATAPGEMTLVTGQRIRNAIEVATHASPIKTLALVGLTNQYMQYFATEEEYPFQYYEGASTLYGPHSEQFLSRHFGRLANKLFDGRWFSSKGQREVNSPAPFEPSPSPLVERMPAEDTVEFLDLDPLKVYRQSRDGAWGWEVDFDHLPLTFTSDRNKFQVQILAKVTGEEIMDDDLGASIEVREVDDDRWRVRWIPDLSDKDKRCGQVFRIAVRGRVHFESHPFVLECETAKASGGQP